MAPENFSRTKLKFGRQFLPPLAASSQVGRKNFASAITCKVLLTAALYQERMLRIEKKADTVDFLDTVLFWFG